MNHVEVSKLLTLIAAIDNRDINEVTVEVWQRIMADYDYEEMAQAVPRYFAETDVYLAPRGLLAQAKKMREAVAEKAKHAELQVEEKSWRSAPEPVCKKHNTRITGCSLCYNKIWDEEQRNGVRGLHEWAVMNVYA
jgi:hypothetical protein